MYNGKSHPEQIGVGVTRKVLCAFEFLCVFLFFNPPADYPDICTYIYVCIYLICLRQCAGRYSFEMKKLAYFVEYHQLHPTNYPSLRILN